MSTFAYEYQILASRMTESPYTIAEAAKATGIAVKDIGKALRCVQTIMQYRSLERASD